MPFPRFLYKKEALAEGHSQEYIEEILKYADHLEDQSLPVIFSLMHFSLLLGFDYFSTQHIIDDRDSFYKVYEIAKKTGGKRNISAPYRSLKIMQKYINEHILSNVEVHEKAFGFVKGKSIYDNALEHINQESILKIDLKNFFGSIKEKQVYSIFYNLGYAKNLSVDFAKITTSTVDSKTFGPSLPQGAPTSPTLSNIRAFKLDLRLNRFAELNKLRYSRYADDITFSGKMKNLPKISFLKKIIKEEGFFLNEKKNRLYDKNSNRRFITGLLVDTSIRVPKKFKKNIYRHLHFCKKFGPQAHIDYHNAKRKRRKDYFYEWLEGKIAFVKMVEPKVGNDMYSILNSINWGVK